MSDKKELKGVGGWLAWLVFAMCLLGPLMMLGLTQNAISSAEHANPAITSLPGWLAYKNSSSTIAWVAAGIIFLGGISLALRHERISVLVAIAALWIANLGSVIADYLATNTHLAQYIGQQAAPASVGAAIKSIIVAGVWTAYLLRSKRVKNTYQ